ncbi:hypothetical protein GCM10007235_21340 [Pseudoxanthomonas indica]|nr:hypothetical protein GCM10007235_21340 [Pseudoxanthomonas indica]
MKRGFSCPSGLGVGQTAQAYAEASSSRQNFPHGQIVDKFSVEDDILPGESRQTHRAMGAGASVTGFPAPAGACSEATYGHTGPWNLLQKQAGPPPHHQPLLEPGENQK